MYISVFEHLCAHRVKDFLSHREKKNFNTNIENFLESGI